MGSRTRATRVSCLALLTTALTFCMKAPSDKQSNSSEDPLPSNVGQSNGDPGSSDPQKEQAEANAKTREEVATDIVARLRKAGITAADANKVKLAMLNVAQSFGLVESQSLSEMIAAMAKAALTTLGTIEASANNPTLRTNAIKAMTTSFVGFTAQKQAGNANLVDSIKLVTAAVAATLKAAKVSDTELTSVLEATTSAAVAAIASQTLTDKSQLAALASSTATAMAEGLKSAGFSPASVATSISGITKGALIAAVQGGVSAEKLGSMAKDMMTGISAAFVNSDINVDTALSHALAGIQVGATVAGVSSAKIQAIVADAHTAAPNVPIAQLPSSTMPAKDEAQSDGPQEASDDVIRFTEWNILTNRTSIKLKGDPQPGDTIPHEFAVSESKPSDEELQNFDPMTLVILDGTPPPDPTFLVKTGKKFTMIHYRIGQNGSWTAWTSVNNVVTLPLNGMADGTYDLFAETKDAENHMETANARLAISHAVSPPTLYSNDDTAGADSSLDGIYRVNASYYNGEFYESIAGYKFWVSTIPSDTCADATFRTYWLKGSPYLTPSNPPADIQDLNYYGGWEGQDRSNGALYESKTYLTCLLTRDAAGNEQTVPTSYSYTPKLRFQPQARADVKTLDLHQAPPLPITIAAEDAYRLIVKGSTFYVLTWKNGVGLKAYDSVDDGSTWTDQGVVFADANNDYYGISDAATAGDGIAVSLLKAGGVTILFSSDGTTFMSQDLESGSSFSSQTISLKIANSKVYVAYDWQQSEDDVSTTKLMFASASIANLASWTKLELKSIVNTYSLRPDLAVQGTHIAITTIPDGYGLPALYLSQNSGTNFTESIVGMPLTLDLDNKISDSSPDSGRARVALMESGATIAVTTDRGVFKRDFTGDTWIIVRADFEKTTIAPPSGEEGPTDSYIQYSPKDSVQSGATMLYWATRTTEIGSARYETLVLDQSTNLTTWSQHDVVDDVSGCDTQVAGSGSKIVVLYCSSEGTMRLARSSNAGGNWNTTLTTVTIPGVFVGDSFSDRAQSVRTNGHLFIINDQQISRSVTGAAWDNLGGFHGYSPLYWPYPIRLAASGNNLYAASYGWLARSTDEGINWNAQVFEAIPTFEQGDLMTEMFVENDDVYVAYAAISGEPSTTVLKLAHSGDGGVTFATPLDLTGVDSANRLRTLRFSDNDLIVGWDVETAGVHVLQIRRYSLSGVATSLPVRIDDTDNYSSYGNLSVTASGSKVSVISSNFYFDYDGSSWSAADDISSTVSDICENSVVMLSAQPAILSYSANALKLYKRAANGSWISSIVDNIDAASCGSISSDAAGLNVLYRSRYGYSTKYGKSTDGGVTFPDLSP